MLAQMNGLPYDAYSDLVCIFGADTLRQLREEFKDNCIGLAEVVKNIMNANGILAEIITFKNGNAFLDGGITINLHHNYTHHNYTHHAVVLMGDWVIESCSFLDIISAMQSGIEIIVSCEDLQR